MNGSDVEEEPAPMVIEPEPIVDVPAFEEETETIVEEPQVAPETEIESDFDEETEFENDEEQFEEDFEEETEEEVDDEIEDNFEKEVEEEVEVPSKVVGERFSKERSLNDMMSDNQTLDKKLSASRIEKIESAIGLNDRFLYIRELFNGDSELFRSTVKELDQMSDIKQAVSHLSNNFKWKKNETSLKFVELVKRRFLS